VSSSAEMRKNSSSKCAGMVWDGESHFMECVCLEQGVYLCLRPGRDGKGSDDLCLVWFASICGLKWKRK